MNNNIRDLLWSALLEPGPLQDDLVNALIQKNAPAPSSSSSLDIGAAIGAGAGVAVTVPLPASMSAISVGLSPLHYELLHMPESILAPLEVEKNSRVDA